MAVFRVALSGDFRKPDGSPAYPMFDLEPLRREPDLELDYVEPVDGVMRAQDLEGFDALILLTSRFDGRSIPPGGRLRLVARFGVGYDNVDVAACTAAGIALVITPEGVRRPVAVSVLTFMLALAGGLGSTGRRDGDGPHRPHAGPARARQHRRRGDPPRQAPRHALPRARPLCRPRQGAGPRRRAGRHRDAVPRSRLRLGQRAVERRDARPRRCAPPRLDETDRLPHQHRARPRGRPTRALRDA